MIGIAATTGSPDPKLIETPQPGTPEAYTVLCSSLQVGVCGTDREILLSERPWVPDGSHQIILGHECLARVEEMGTDVAGFEVGDLVVPVVRRASTDMNRRADLLPFGRYVERGIAFEDGFTAPFWIDRPEHLFKVNPVIESVAVLTEPLTVAEKAINEALAVQRGRLDDAIWRDTPPRVLVTGMGPIAFAAVIACRCRKWTVKIYGRDADDSFRAQLAISLGADYLPSTQVNFTPDDVEADGYDLILECTGSDEVMIRSAEALASCGVMVWVGASRVPMPKSHNLSRMMRNGILRNHIHIGTVNAAPRDFVDALAHLEQMYATHSRELESLITDRVAPADSLWHYQNRRSQGIKTVLMYE